MANRLASFFSASTSSSGGNIPSASGSSSSSSSSSGSKGKQEAKKVVPTEDDDEIAGLSSLGSSDQFMSGVQPTKYEPEFHVPSGPFASVDSPDNILFEDTVLDGIPLIKAGTIAKLVERVTLEAYPDVKFLGQFLLTYRSFMTGMDLLHLLRLRCNLPPPRHMNPEQEDRYLKKFQQPIRLRVFNLIKSWVNQYTHDFVDDPQLTNALSDFLDTLATFDGMAAGAKALKLQLKKKAAGASSKKREVTHRTEPPKPIIPKDSSTLLDVSPLEMARQLTIIESELYRSIKPWEFLNQAWAKKGGVGAPNVLEMIHWSTKISGFVATEIMKTQIQKKVRIIQFFIQVGQALLELNNFNALMEILAGFENAAVWRLQPFFQEVPKKYGQVMEELRSTMSTNKNMKSIREALRKVDMPCIPYLGMFLTDLTFIEDGNPDTVKNDLVNFTKRRYVAQVIQDIQQYQNIPYCLTPVPTVQNFFRTSVNWDDEKLYQVSLQFMPRNAKDKTVKELETLYLETEKELKAAKKKELEEDIDWGPLEEMDGYVFRDKDGPENILFDERGTLVAATLPKLIERLTGRPTPGFMETFLVSWPTFCTAQEFSRLILSRFNPPRPVNDKKHEEYQKSFVLSVKTRVVNILKALVEKFSFHFVGSPNLVKIFLPLLREIHQSAGVLSKTVERIEGSLTNLAEESAKEPKPFDRSPSSPFGISPIRGPAPDKGVRGTIVEKGGTFYRDSPHEFAEELTLTHHQLFLSLRPQCLLVLKLEGDTVVSTDPYWSDALINFLRSYVKAESFLYDFIVSQIVAGAKPSDRAVTIESFILLCDLFWQMYNFCGVIWVLNALTSKTVRKLSRSWAEVSHVRLDQFRRLQVLVKDLINVNTFRERTSEPGDRFVKPSIPPVTSYINSFIQRLNLPDRTENGLINFTKREGMATLIMDIMKLQKLNYEIAPNSEAERFVSFQQRKLLMKADTVNRCKAVLKEETSPNQQSDAEEHFFQYLPPDYNSTYSSFANSFLKNHSLFELLY
jgi:hypothetical protein